MRRGRWPGRRVGGGDGPLRPPGAPAFAYFARPEFVVQNGGVEVLADSLAPSSLQRALTQAAAPARPALDVSSYSQPALVGDGLAQYLTCTTHPAVQLASSWSWYWGTYGRVGGVTAAQYNPAVSNNHVYLASFTAAQQGAIRNGGITTAAPGTAPIAGALRRTLVRTLGVGLDYDDSSVAVASGAPDRSPFGAVGLSLLCILNPAVPNLFSADPVACWLGYPVAHSPAEQLEVNDFVGGYIS